MKNKPLLILLLAGTGLAFGSGQTRPNATNQVRNLPASGPTEGVNRRCSDPVVTQVSDTELLVGKYWTPEFPCSFRWGVNVISIDRPLSIQLVGGANFTGMIRAEMTRGNGVRVTADGIASDALAPSWIQVSGYPGLVRSGNQWDYSSIPIFQWYVMSGKFQGPGTVLLADSFQFNFMMDSSATQLIINDTGVLAAIQGRSSLVARAQPPAAPGACDASKNEVWSADPQYFYLCIPDGNGGHRWSRTPLQTQW